MISYTLVKFRLMDKIIIYWLDLEDDDHLYTSQLRTSWIR